MANIPTGWEDFSDTVSPDAPDFGEMNMLPFGKEDYFQVTRDCLEIPLRKWYLCERNGVRYSKFKKEAKMPFFFDTWLELYLKINNIKYIFYSNNLDRLVHFKKGLRPNQ